MRILVVEDDPVLADGLKVGLGLAGSTVDVVFTAADARGQGAGSALIEAVYERAREAGASRVYWLTHETNTTARALYDKLAHDAGFIQYRKDLG